jgi:hypothetical protein
MAFYNNVLIGLGVETQCIASLLFGMCIIWQKKSPIGGAVILWLYFFSFAGFAAIGFGQSGSFFL